MIAVQNTVTPKWGETGLLEKAVIPGTETKILIFEQPPPVARSEGQKPDSYRVERRPGAGDQITARGAYDITTVEAARSKANELWAGGITQRDKMPF